MTTTAERAELLEAHCLALDCSKFLGEFSTQDLLEWVKLELGSKETLDKFVNYGDSAKGKLSMAMPNGPILHILSGNTPHAGLQSLLRGLLVGARNIVKLPSGGLPEVSEWMNALPEQLANLVTVVDTLDDEIFRSARTVIAIGSDATMQEIQKRISPKQRFIPHGHKLSIGLVKTPSPEMAELVVRDACAFNQQGCLSLHTVYVMEGAREFLPMIAKAMQTYETMNPRGEIGISESGSISNLREATKYEMANDPENIAMEHSAGDTSSTAIYRNAPTLTPSPLNRVISVQPWPDRFEMLGVEREFISTLAVEKSILDEITFLDTPRVCLLGKSQTPSLTWHHDGFAPLASLVRWRDLDR